MGLFEANALQFGLDQLLEAPTPKLIAFIHWYYWTHQCSTIGRNLPYTLAGHLLGTSLESIPHDMKAHCYK